MSGLNNYLLGLLHGVFVGGLFPALYCDGFFLSYLQFYHDFEIRQLMWIFEYGIGFITRIDWVFLANHRTRFWLFAAPHDLFLFGHGVKIQKLCLDLSSHWIVSINLVGLGVGILVLPLTLEEYIPFGDTILPPAAVSLG